MTLPRISGSNARISGISWRPRFSKSSSNIIVFPLHSIEWPRQNFFMTSRAEKNELKSAIGCNFDKYTYTTTQWQKQRWNPLQLRHNESDGVSNNKPHDCLLNRLFKAQIKENIKAPRHRWPVNSPHKGQVTRKMFPFDDVILNGLVQDYSDSMYVLREKCTFCILRHRCYGSKEDSFHCCGAELSVMVGDTRSKHTISLNLKLSQHFVAENVTDYHIIKPSNRAMLLQTEL